MPIVYRDRLRPRSASPRWPAWLGGAADISRREDEAGDLVAVVDPILFTDPAGARWTPVGDDWDAAVVGELSLRPLLRVRPDCNLLLVTDGAGRDWHVPAILDPAGKVALAVQLGVVGTEPDGTQRWGRIPSAEQEALVAAARAARDEIEAGRLADVPIAAACAWAATALAAVYHIPARAFGTVVRIDDRLVAQTLLAIAGLPQPRAAD